MSTKVRQIIGLLMIIIAIFMLIWGEGKFLRQIKTVYINTNNIFPSIDDGGDSMVTESLFSRTPMPLGTSGAEEWIEKSAPSATYILVLDAPGKIRIGDADYIQLKIIPDGLEGTPEFTSNGDEIYRHESTTTKNSSYNLLAETRLELPGVLYKPSADIITSFQAGQVVSLYWTVQPENSGAYQGIVWLHFQFVPDDGSEALRLMVSRQVIDISAVSFAGLSGNEARIIGWVGFIIGLALDVDFWIAIYRKYNHDKGNKIHA